MPLSIQRRPGTVWVKVGDLFLPDVLYHLQHTFDSPTVYLDHWAVRRFSRDPGLGARFLTALKAKGGTLALSHMTFVEFTQNSGDSIVEGAAFLESALPNIYFLDLDFTKAEAQEARDVDREPPPDVDFLKACVRPDEMGFSTTRLLTVVADSDYLGQRFAETNAKIVAHIRARCDEPGFVESARAYIPKVSPRDRTKTIFKEMVRPLVLNGQIVDNDGGDLQHAVVPLSYCDFVLLDGKWKEGVRQMHKRYADLSPPLRHGECFSDRGDDVDQFLTRLEGW